MKLELLNSTIQKVMDDLGRAPAPKQMAVGGVAGWAAGYVTMKAGKMAATAIGGTAFGSNFQTSEYGLGRDHRFESSRRALSF